MSRLSPWPFVLALLLTALPAQAAVAVVTSTTVTDATGASTDVTPPSGLAAGDLWFIYITIDTDGGWTIAIPSGWTSAVANLNGADDGFASNRGMWKIAGAGEAAVTVTASGTGSAYTAFATSIRLTGHHATTPIDTTASANPTGGGTTVQTGAVTVANNDSLAILATSVYLASGAYNLTEPSGSTAISERSGTDTWPGGAVAYEARNAGSYTPNNWTSSASVTNRTAHTIIIAPAAAGGGSPPSGLLMRGAGE